MAGMVTTGTTGTSAYDNRTVSMEVTCLCRQDVMKRSKYTVKVPFNRMSKTMQLTNRLGGKFSYIKLLPGS